MKYWKKLSPQDCSDYIDKALEENINFTSRLSLGVPASKLDGKVFYDQATFLKDAPLLRSIVQNPNHIGCHTVEESELFFPGTQRLERELITTVAVDILQGEDGQIDGYVATGGTEANIQAAWMYRNYFVQEHNAHLSEIALIASTDTHYSIVKASNLLSVDYISVPVDIDTRQIDNQDLSKIVAEARANGKKYFIVFCNMATTMFGSIDDPDMYVQVFEEHKVLFKIHVDGAFGGFIYPLVQPNNNICFQNKHVSSITLDAHKMLQAPYGTGMFLARKGLMKYVFTKEASYVHGMDITLCGSRSGANAIAIWMILMAYGPFGWFEKMNTLLYRTTWMCKQLDDLGVKYYRHPSMNIITIKSQFVAHELAEKYGLVPDAHDGAALHYKIVVMEHVDIEALQLFLSDMKVHLAK